MPINNYTLHRARVVKNDEFYTQYDDVKKECDNYMPHFFNKIIYCNCDTDDSAFVKYFLDLKARGKIRDVIWSGGLGGLDFRSDAAVAILKRADIVVTNPPFSLFREFIDLLMEYDKQFLIIGNINAVSYQNMDNYIKDNKVWVGIQSMGSMRFNTPDGNITGIPTVWFTNIRHNHQRGIILNKNYYGNESAYPQYDNADAINVGRVSDIPSDYFGIMGVPITFACKYNPGQFEWLGADYKFTNNKKRGQINNQTLYARVFIRRRCNN